MKREKSTTLQLSATQILNFLVNDMLDYAQLSSGQFRKFFKKFNLIESVKDIVNIMKYKADEFGIDIRLDFNNFELSHQITNQINTFNLHSPN